MDLVFLSFEGKYWSSFSALLFGSSLNFLTDLCDSEQPFSIAEESTLTATFESGTTSALLEDDAVASSFMATKTVSSYGSTFLLLALHIPFLVLAFLPLRVRLFTVLVLFLFTPSGFSISGRLPSIPAFFKLHSFVLLLLTCILWLWKMEIRPKWIFINIVLFIIKQKSKEVKKNKTRAKHVKKTCKKHKQIPSFNVFRKQNLMWPYGNKGPFMFSSPFSWPKYITMLFLSWILIFYQIIKILKKVIFDLFSLWKRETATSAISLNWENAIKDLMVWDLYYNRRKVIEI